MLLFCFFFFFCVPVNARLVVNLIDVFVSACVIGDPFCSIFDFFLKSGFL